MAHDNPMLNHRESELIVGGVFLVMKFLKSFEEGEPEEEFEEDREDWELPF